MRPLTHRLPLTPPQKRAGDGTSWATAPRVVAYPRFVWHCPFCFVEHQSVQLGKQGCKCGRRVVVAEVEDGPEAAPGEGVSRSIRAKRNRRARVLRKTGGRCFYCNKRLGTDWTEDHMVPRSLGGRTEEANLVPACSRCNQEKGSMTAEEYVEERAARALRT